MEPTCHLKRQPRKERRGARSGERGGMEEWEERAKARKSLESEDLKRVHSC